MTMFIAMRMQRDNKRMDGGSKWKLVAKDPCNSCFGCVLDFIESNMVRFVCIALLAMK